MYLFEHDFSAGCYSLTDVCADLLAVRTLASVSMVVSTSRTKDT